MNHSYTIQPEGACTFPASLPRLDGCHWRPSPACPAVLPAFPSLRLPPLLSHQGDGPEAQQDCSLRCGVAAAPADPAEVSFAATTERPSVELYHSAKGEMKVVGTGTSSSLVLGILIVAESLGKVGDA